MLVKRTSSNRPQDSVQEEQTDDADLDARNDERHRRRTASWTLCSVLLAGAGDRPAGVSSGLVPRVSGPPKAETAAKHGEDQVKIWRRSFDIPPPAMDLIHPYYNIIVNDAR